MHGLTALIDRATPLLTPSLQVCHCTLLPCGSNARQCTRIALGVCTCVCVTASCQLRLLSTLLLCCQVGRLPACTCHQL